MHVPPEPEEFQEKLKKRGRIQKLTPKVHQIAKEEGRGLKDLWRRIVDRSKKLEGTQPSPKASAGKGEK